MKNNTDFDNTVEKLTVEIRNEILNAGDNLDDEKIKCIIEDYIFNNMEDFSLEEVSVAIHKIFSKIRCRLGVIEDLTKNDDINEIMINGPSKLFYEKKDGITFLENVFSSTEELEEVMRNIAADVHREINEMNPILDARLKDGSRVNAVYKNIAADGPVLTIRKFPKGRITIKDMIRKGTLTEECASVLKTLVESGYNIFVSGGTSSGKTTFLNALSDYIPKGERVIVIEDSRELQLTNIDNLVQMECHNANSLGQGKISMAHLIKTSLRMRPDRVLVGEVRGKEVADMLQAMNTGHDGSLSTGHGNSVAGMLRRLEAMYLMSASIPMDAIRAQIVEAIDIMVHLGRLSNGKRMILEIEELIDYSDGKYVLNKLFEIDGSYKLNMTGNKIINRQKLILKGYEDGFRL